MLAFKMLDITWFVPSCVKFETTYPSGLVHIVVNTMTLISNTISQMVRFCIRNDMVKLSKDSLIITSNRHQLV